LNAQTEKADMETHTHSQVARNLRRHWKLGLAPIEGLIELLKDRGIKVELQSIDIEESLG